MTQLRREGLNMENANFLRYSVRELGDSALQSYSEGSDTVDGDDESALTITRTITTPAIDRYGDIVLPRGCQASLHKYLSNPLVFFAHRSSELPIASCTDVQIFDNKIVAVAKFHEETDEARTIWRLRKLLKATSIGFLPFKASIIGSNKDEEQELEERMKKRKEKTPDGEKVITFDPWCALRFLEWEMLEWSVVPVPANPECVESFQKILSDGKVEGQALPDSIRKSLSSSVPTGKKGRVWVHGFDPEKESHTGLVSLGGHELEFDAGKITKIDGYAFVPSADPGDPVPDPTGSADPGSKKPGDPLLNKTPTSVRKDVKAGEQDPSNPLILGVPDICQPNHFSCGLCATWEVAKFFGVGPDSYDEWQKILGTSVEESTHPERIVKALTDLGLTIEARQNMTYEDLELQWLSGHPVIICCQDYGVFVPREAKFPYGHYLVVIGAFMDKVLCQDSSEGNVVRGSDSIQEDGRVLIDRAKFEENWVDVDVDGNKYDHYGIVCCMDGDIPPPVQLIEEAKKFLKGRDD